MWQDFIAAIVREGGMAALRLGREEMCTGDITKSGLYCAVLFFPHKFPLSAGTRSLVCWNLIPCLLEPDICVCWISTCAWQEQVAGSGTANSGESGQIAHSLLISQVADSTDVGGCSVVQGAN